MSEVPWVLLRKRVTKESLSKNLVCQFSSKSWVTHYVRVTKKKTNMTSGLKHQSNKQTNCSYKRKWYIYLVSICGSCLKLFGVGYASSSISSGLSGLCLYLDLFYSKWLMPLSRCTHLVPRRICTQVPESSFLIINCSEDLCLHVQFSKDICTKHGAPLWW